MHNLLTAVMNASLRPPPPFPFVRRPARNSHAPGWAWWCSCCSWRPSILNFQDPRFMNGRMPVQSYVWDTMNPNTPDVALTPPSPLCCLRFNPKVLQCPAPVFHWICFFTRRTVGTEMLSLGLAVFFVTTADIGLASRACK